MSTTPLLASGLKVWWGPLQVVFDLDLAVQAGESVALLGRNGAGKSSLLMGLAGWTTHSAQALRWCGQDSLDWPAHERARAGLGLVPQERRIFTDLTVRENLAMGTHARGPRPSGVPQFGEDEVLQLFPSLKPRLNHWGNALSGGEQQMLAIGRALMGHPQVLLMDEPTEGLAPKVIDDLQHALQVLSQSGVAIVLAEQNHAFAQALCARTLWLDNGHLAPAPLTQ
jgi:branched-chain amino acid transport system ATP-binding protein